MNWLSKAIRRLKGRLFGIEQRKPKTETAKHTPKVIEDEGPIVGLYTSLERKRDPYFIQIGLDFGFFGIFTLKILHSCLYSCTRM